MEGLYKGQHGTGLVAFGILDPSKKPGDGRDAFLTRVEIPRLMSILGYRNAGAFVPGVEDLLQGGFKPEFDAAPAAEKGGALPVSEKIVRGKKAVAALAVYRKAKEEANTMRCDSALTELRQNFPWFGYAFLNAPESVIPNVPMTFYSFHLMVLLGFYFIFLFAVILFLHVKEKLEKQRWLLWLAVWTIPLVYLASEAGWVVAEVGRQPWVIQDLLPTMAAVSKIDATSVVITFWLFAALFTVLLVAELSIMIKQIQIGPKDGGTH